jgi:hypothetical protein
MAEVQFFSSVSRADSVIPELPRQVRGEGTIRQKRQSGMEASRKRAIGGKM